MSQRPRRIVSRIAAILVLAFAVLFVLPGAGLARERILSFDSDITIQPDASVLVRETITVISERREIQRGIYRDFPTDYRTRRGDRVRVGFDVLSVTRNVTLKPSYSYTVVITSGTSRPSFQRYNPPMVAARLGGAFTSMA